MLKIELSFVVILLLFFTFSCGNDESGNKYVTAANCSGISPIDNTYTNTIKDIIDNNCAFSGCHDAGTASDGIDLSSYTKVKDNFINGSALCAVNHDGCEPMPKDALKLDAGNLNLLACWVKEGSPQ